MNTGVQLGAEYLRLLVRIFVKRGANSTHTSSELSLTLKVMIVTTFSLFLVYKYFFYAVAFQMFDPNLMRLHS